MEKFGPHGKNESGIENTVEGRFNLIKDSTMCPFSKKSKLEFAHQWNRHASFEENMTFVSKELEDFTEKCEKDHLDGFVLEAKGVEFSKDLEALSFFLKNALGKLQDLDPKNERPLDQNILDPHWQFTFNKTRLFIITFAPFYQKTNPRYSFTDDSVFIFFQPDSSFNSHIINPAASEQTVNLKKRIRAIFTADGRPYDEAIINSPFDAVKYIKPLNIGDQEIRWWEDDKKDKL